MWLVVGIPRIRKRKPRASGDDPDVAITGFHSAAVNPARAGMIPALSHIEHTYTSKPRASGDDPHRAQALLSGFP